MLCSKNRLSVSVVVATLVAAVTGCGGNNGPSTTGTGGQGQGGSGTTSGTGGEAGATTGSGAGGGGPTLDAACAQVAAADCGAFVACAKFLLDISYADQAECELRTKATCVSNYGLQGVTATPGDVAACAAALTAASCQAFFSGIPACAFEGSLADGASCSSYLQCKGICDKSQGSGDCGVCATAPAAGSDCDPSSSSIYQCSFGDYCSSATSKCAPHLAENAPCAETEVCAGTLACVGGKCTQPAGEGEPCPTGYECDFFNGLSCDFGAPPTCVKLVLASAGEDCSDILTWCDHAGSCDVDTFKCVAAAKDGDPCMASLDCLPGATCVGQVCTLGGAAVCP